MNKYLVKTDSTLMEFLLNHYNKKNVKNLLKFKQVSVNGQVISQFDYSLKRDDEIVVDRNPNNNSSLDIIYEDRELIVINKPAGLLSMAGGNEKEKYGKRIFLASNSKSSDLVKWLLSGLRVISRENGDLLIFLHLRAICF